jgi:hypothetical protein
LKQIIKFTRIRKSTKEKDRNSLIMISSFRHVSYLKDFIDKDNLIYNTLEDNLNRRVNSFEQPQAGQFALFFMTMKH